MGDVLRNRVAGADVGDTHIGGFACLAEGVVPRIEELAFLLEEREELVNHVSDTTGRDTHLELVL